MKDKCKETIKGQIVLTVEIVAEMDKKLAGTAGYVTVDGFRENIMGDAVPKRLQEELNDSIGDQSDGCSVRVRVTRKRANVWEKVGPLPEDESETATQAKEDEAQ